MTQEEEMRKEFSRRLALICDKAGIEIHGRQAMIASALQVTPKAVSKWFNAEAIPRRAKMQALANYIGVKADWFLSSGKEASADISPAMVHKQGAFRVELLDVQASAGPGCLASSDVIETIRAIEYTSEQARSLFGHRASEAIKVITVRGDSMEGTIDPGDQIFLDMNITHFDGDGIYVFVFGKTVHIKRLQMHKNSLLVLSDNPRYKEWYIDESDEDQFYIMAKVLLKQSIEYKRF
ncbi:S24 family peptidase [Enterobacteriaceae bacterium LUAb1]